MLLPMPFARVNRQRGRVTVDAILGSQFADVPATGAPTRSPSARKTGSSAITAAGTLYATPARQEPLL